MKHPIGQRRGDAVRLPQGDAPPCAAHGEGRALHRQGSLELPAAPPIGQGEIQEARSGSRAPDHGLQGNIQRCLLRLRRGDRKFSGSLSGGEQRGGLYGLPDGLYRLRRGDGGGFYVGIHAEYRRQGEGDQQPDQHHRPQSQERLFGQTAEGCRTQDGDNGDQNAPGKTHLQQIHSDLLTPALPQCPSSGRSALRRASCGPAERRITCPPSRRRCGQSARWSPPPGQPPFPPAHGT